MNAAAVIDAVEARGGTLTTDGARLRLRWMNPVPHWNENGWRERDALTAQVTLQRKALYRYLMEPTS